jgi:hypothetical protein
MIWKAGPHAALLRSRTCAASPVGACTDRNGYSSVKRSLLLGRGKCPCGTRAALLTEDEPQLLGRGELCLGGTKRGAGLGELQRTEQVAPEVAVIACDLACGSLALRSRHLFPFDSRLDHLGGRIKALRAPTLKGAWEAVFANRRENRLLSANSPNRTSIL